MNHKIDSYIHALFAGIPRTKKAQELKEKLLSKMHDRYADYLREGKSDAQAYSLTVASMGDVKTSPTTEKEFFTRAEVAAMDQATVSRYFDKIRKSQQYWK